MSFVPINITKLAAKEINHILEKKNIPDGYGLRVGIKGAGGCGGMSFILGFDKKKETDDHFKIHSIDVYIEKKHVLFLAGQEIDFYDEADGRGFTFRKQVKNA